MAKEQSIICPYCQSDDIAGPRYSMQAAAISIILLGFPFIFIGKQYHCFNCDKDFKKKDAHHG